VLAAEVAKASKQNTKTIEREELASNINEILGSVDDSQEVGPGDEDAFDYKKAYEDAERRAEKYKSKLRHSKIPLF